MSISAETAGMFVDLRTELFQQAPEIRAEAKKHADELVDPQKADADQIWAILWNRPVFAGRTEAGALKFIERVQSSMAHSWRAMDDASRYGIVRKVDSEDQHHWLSDEAFEVTGTVVTEWHRTHKLPAKTLYAITNAGKALLKRSSKTTPYSDLVGRSDLERIDMLMQEFGWGWKHTTVCHFLLDLGLACKPDIHLVRTMKVLGLYDGNRDQVTKKQAVEVVASVKKLVVAVHGRYDRRLLREMDKHLMEISSKGIIENPFAKAAPEQPKTSVE